MNAQLITVRLKDIHDNPFQSKERDYEVESLARSIAEHGLQQTPRARSINGHYELKFGHRRFRAFQWLKENWKTQGLVDRYDGYQTMPLEVEELNDDDLFDHMVVENVHRNDLKPTEEAALLKQWLERHPNATSRDASVVFNKKDATIRGMVRLLDLPMEAQKALDEGKISQNTARQLLSMQKVAPTVIVKALDEIEEEKKGSENSRWGGQRVPEDVVVDLLEEQPEVVQLWYDGRGKEKPRAKGSDGWLLDMKNFPNHYLPVLTPVDAAIALVVQDDPKILAILEEMLVVDELIRLDDLHAAGLSQEQVGKLSHLIMPPACTACPFYTTLRGTHYCGMKTCFTRKSQAWDREKLNKASKSLGIALYDREADGEFKVLTDGYSYKDNSQEVALFKKRHKDLRLALMADIDRKKDQHGYEGVPAGSVVLVVGKAMESLQEEKREARVEKEAQVDFDEMLDHKRKMLNWEATAYFQSMFDGLNEHAAKVLMESSYNWKFDESDLDELFGTAPSNEFNYKNPRRFLALQMLFEASGPLAKSCVTHAEWIRATGTTWGVKVPARFTKLAEQYDAEIKEAKKSVAAETLRPAPRDAKRTRSS